MVEILGVTKASNKETTMSETVNDRVMGYTVAGIEYLLGEQPMLQIFHFAKFSMLQEFHLL